MFILFLLCIECKSSENFALCVQFTFEKKKSLFFYFLLFQSSSQTFRSNYGSKGEGDLDCRLLIVTGEDVMDVWYLVVIKSRGV